MFSAFVELLPATLVVTLSRYVPAGRPPAS